MAQSTWVWVLGLPKSAGTLHAEYHPRVVARDNSSVSYRSKTVKLLDMIAAPRKGERTLRIRLGQAEAPMLGVATRYFHA